MSASKMLLGSAVTVAAAAEVAALQCGGGRRWKSCALSRQPWWWHFSEGNAVAARQC